MSNRFYTIDGQFVEDDQVKIDLKSECVSKYAELSQQPQAKDEVVEKFSNSKQESQKCGNYIINTQNKFLCSK
jgi:hypothetical protein